MSDKELEKIKKEKAKRLMESFSQPQESSMPSGVLDLNTMEQYKNILKQYPGKILIIDFWATWCAPCKMFAPIFQKLQQQYSESFIFARVNVDKNQYLARQYQITAIPTTLFLRDGKIINKVIGASNYNKMRQILERLKQI